MRELNNIPEPIFTPVNEIENFIYGNDKFILKSDGKHYCRYCNCVQSPWSGDYSHFSGCVHLIKEFDILNDGYFIETPPDETEDNKVIEHRDLVICFILLVVAAITIAAHWIFGG